jgi:titin
MQPSNATAVGLSTTEISLGWQDNSTNETGFEIHFSIPGAPETGTILTFTGADVESFVARGFPPDTEYCFRVRAVLFGLQKTRHSSFSNIACATTMPLPPTPPNGVVYVWPVEVSGGGGIEVTWIDRSNDEDGFRIERADYSDLATWTVVGTVGANVTSFLTDQPVCYRVIAFNAEANSQPSETGCTAPAAPSNVTLTVLGDGTREVTWSDNSTIEDTYELWVGSGSRCCPGSGMCDAGYYENPFDFLPANTTSYRTGLDSDECQTFTLILMASRMGVQSEPAYVGVP